MKFQRYEEYVDSGLPWLGDIPSEWKIQRIKDLTKTFSGTTPQSGNGHYYDNGHTYWVRTTDLNNSELYKSEFKVTEKAFDDYGLKYLPLDSILLAMYGGIGTIGKNSILKVKATLNQSVCSILPNHKKFDSKFLLYFMQYFKYKWIIFADSSRKDPNINQDAIKNLFIILPSLQIQIKIASYLDTQIEKIDKQIALLEQKKERYKELKQTLINETVLRGLDKSVELKDSGIEWIGKIPKHWEIKRLKDSSIVFTGNSISDKEKYLEKNNSFPYIATKDINVNTQVIDYDNGMYIPKNNAGFKVAKKDSILLCIEGGSAGKKIAFTKTDICFVNKLCAIKSKDYKLLDKFLFYYISSSLFKNQFFSIINGLIGGVSITSIKNFTILTPSSKEQTKIATYLDEKTQKIDNITQAISDKIELLKEFRKTLINDVVTGKVKVA